MRGYKIGSDDESSSDGDYTDDRNPFLQVTTRDKIHTWMGPESSQAQFPFEWLVASVLPTYTEKIQTAHSSESFMRRLLSSFKTYTDLRNATVDSEYEAVFVRLQQEWTYIGCTVCHGVDLTASIQPYFISFPANGPSYVSYYICFLYFDIDLSRKSRHWCVFDVFRPRYTLQC
jgi:hypothetical protein